MRMTAAAAVVVMAADGERLGEGGILGWARAEWFATPPPITPDQPGNH